MDARRPAARLSRRRALGLIVGGAGLSLAAACAPIQAPQAPKPTDAPTKPSEAKPAPTSAAAPGAPAPAAKSTAVAAPKRGGVLTVSAISDILHFDAHALPSQNRPIYQQIYNSLTIDDEQLKPQPELAESWEFSPDNLGMTLKLRRGVTFHSGRDFTAEDVIWNLQRLQDPKVAANSRVLALAIKEAQAVDPLTVKFTFERPAPGIFDLLDLFYIMDREVEDVKSNGVGTGPFKVVNWAPGDQLRLARYEGYWRQGFPHLDEVVIKAMPDAAGRIVSLESGAVDLVLQPLNNDWVRLKQGGRFQTPSGADGNVVLDFLMNVSEKPFDDRRVRQAFNMAVDRKRILDTVFAGVGEQACIPFPKHSFAYDAEAAASCRFDLDGARKLLTEAGHGSGLEVTAIADSSVVMQRQFAELYQADLAKIGVQMKLNILEPSQYRPATFGHKFQAAFHQFGRANKDPDGLFRIAVAWYPSTEGFTTFTSPEYERLVAEAGATMDQGRRKALYAELMKLIVTESFTLSVVSIPQIWAIAPHVRDFAWNLDGHEVLERVWLDR